MHHTAFLAEPLPASIGRDSKARQTGALFYNDREECRSSGSTSSVMNKSASKVEIVNGLRNVDVNLDAK